jgi:acetolactate synthase I/II/III large subunit
MMSGREKIVFLAAVGGGVESFAPQLAALAPQYECRCLDLVDPSRTTIAAMADHAASFGPAHYVGLSLGGVVAQEVLRRHRDRVRSLTLANSWAWLEDGAARRAWVEGELAREGLPRFSRESLPGLFAPTTDRALVEEAVRIESGKDPAAYLAAWRAMLAVDQRDLVIDVPLLLVGGALDTVTPTSLLRAIPGGRLVELAGASHFSNLDQPEAFTAALRAFLRGLGSADHDRGTTESVDCPAEMAAERLLRQLEARGVGRLYSNSGTDFTPIIEGLAHLEPAGLRVVQVAHENTAIAMAHGDALATGRAAAVMAHVNVGTANMGLGLVNARRAHVPMLVLAGRTPWYEEGVDGARSNFVQWGQEAFDQGAMFREFTKWDYELRSAHGLTTTVDRALAVAESDPQGPVYLVLPKEPLCETAAPELLGPPRQRAAVAGGPPARLLDEAAARLRAARKPLVITADVGRHAGAFEALRAFAHAAKCGVVEHGKRNFANFSTEDPHHLGFDPHPWLGDCDLVIAVECPVPWIPAWAKVTVPVISIGVDPLFSDLPRRGFAVDVALAGDPTATLRELAERVRGVARGEWLAAAHERTFGDARAAAATQIAGGTITKASLSYALGTLLGDDDVVFNEYDADPLLVPRTLPRSWFENSVASGLGWSLGAALGHKIAAPERHVVVTLGDGSYLFNTPLSAHQVAAAEHLSALIVVYNDQGWSTIKRSTRGSHPGGVAARTGKFALCDFAVDVAYEKIAEACGGTGLRIATPAELVPKLTEALAIVRRGGGLVLANVICAKDG